MIVIELNGSLATFWYQNYKFWIKIELCGFFNGFIFCHLFFWKKHTRIDYNQPKYFKKFKHYKL